MKRTLDVASDTAGKKTTTDTEEKDTGGESKQQEKSSRTESAVPNQQAKPETLRKIFANLAIIQDIARFVADPSILNDKRGQYCIQLNMAVMGEAARQVLRLLETNHEFMPRACSAMPWKTLINLRNLCTHQAHDQNLEELFKAIKQDIPQLEAMAAQMRAFIQHNQHEQQAHEREPIPLTTIDAYGETIKVLEKKKNEEKSKDESRKDPTIDKLSKQVKGLRIIMEELNNIRDFLRAGNDQVTLYACQMAMMRIGLVVKDRFDEEFQNKHPLQLDPITWKTLVQLREEIIHRNEQLDPRLALSTAAQLQPMLPFFQQQYEQQNAQLRLLKSEHHQRLQASKGGEKEEKQEKVDSAPQPTRRLETSAPFSFSLKQTAQAKPPPTIRATVFMQPATPSASATSATIASAQGNQGDTQRTGQKSGESDKSAVRQNKK